MVWLLEAVNSLIRATLCKALQIPKLQKEPRVFFPV